MNDIIVGFYIRIYTSTSLSWKHFKNVMKCVRRMFSSIPLFGKRSLLCNNKTIQIAIKVCQCSNKITLRQLKLRFVLMLSTKKYATDSTNQFDTRISVDRLVQIFKAPANSVIDADTYARIERKASEEETLFVLDTEYWLTIYSIVFLHAFSVF